MLNKHKTGLIVVDIQGKLATSVHNSEALISSMLMLIEGVKVLNLPIICLEQRPTSLGVTVPAISDALPSKQVISKHTFSGAGCQEFVDAINNTHLDTWLVCGMETHVCVYQTVSDLLAKNVKVQVVADCVSSRTLFNKELAITAMMEKGASITSVEMCLFELVADSLSPEFKRILQIIK